jgi:hypothetical protein
MSIYKYDVYCVHNSEKIVEYVCSRLNGKNWKRIYANTQDSPEVRDKNVRHSKIVLCFLTSSFAETEMFKQEILVIRNAFKKLFFVLLENFDIDQKLKDSSIIYEYIKFDAFIEDECKTIWSDKLYDEFYIRLCNLMVLSRFDRSRYDVFISYHRKSSGNIADWIVSKLKSLNLKIWLDNEQINYGNNLYDRITNGILDSSIVVCLMNSDYINSEACTLEYKFAHNKKKKCLYLMLEDLIHNGNLLSSRGFEIHMQDSVRVNIYKGKDPIEYLKSNFQNFYYAIRDSLIEIYRDESLKSSIGDLEVSKTLEKFKKIKEENEKIQKEKVESIKTQFELLREQNSKIEDLLKDKTQINNLLEEVSKLNQIVDDNKNKLFSCDKRQIFCEKLENNLKEQEKVREELRKNPNQKLISELENLNKIEKFTRDMIDHCNNLIENSIPVETKKKTVYAVKNNEKLKQLLKNELKSSLNRQTILLEKVQALFANCYTLAGEQKKNIQKQMKIINDCSTLDQDYYQSVVQNFVLFKDKIFEEQKVLFSQLNDSIEKQSFIKSELKKLNDEVCF